MLHDLISPLLDARLLEMALCLGCIAALRWINVIR